MFNVFKYYDSGKTGKLDYKEFARWIYTPNRKYDPSKPRTATPQGDSKTVQKSTKERADLDQVSVSHQSSHKPTSMSQSIRSNTQSSMSYTANVNKLLDEIQVSVSQRGANGLLYLGGLFRVTYQ